MNLTLLAHGSPDPRHERSVSALAGRLKVAGTAAQPAYLDHHEPSPATVATALDAARVPATTVVPLLVSPAYHARVDVPVAVANMRSAAPGMQVTASDPVGLHPLLVAAARELIDTSGMRLSPGTGVILAAAGSRDLRVVAAMEALTRTHAGAFAASLGVRAMRAAYLTGGRPLGRIRTLMRSVDGCTDFVVVTMVVAEGILRDRIVAAADRYDTPTVPGALGSTNALAELIVLRAATARAALDPASTT